MKGKTVKSEIIQSGNPILRAKARPILEKEFGTKELQHVLNAMNTALERESDGVAIAAPQIGISQRIFIVSRKAFTIDGNMEHENVSTKEKIPKKNLVCINPEIVKLSRKKLKVPEGCLSVRWLFGNTIRNEKATIRARDENGKLFTYGGSGLIAQIFQHEYDHLEGTLFIDHATNIEELTPEEIAAIQTKSADAR